MNAAPHIDSHNTDTVIQNSRKAVLRDPRLQVKLMKSENSLWQLDHVPVVKKRGLNLLSDTNTDSSAKRPAVLSDYTVNVSNRFDPISEENSMDEEIRPELLKHKTQPIFVTGVNSIHELKQIISNICTDPVDKLTITTLKSGHTVKISPQEISTYKKLREHFLLKNISHYTFQLKHERAYRVVLRGIHHSESTQFLKEELEKLGHQVRNITNVLHRQTKEPLALFFVDLEPCPNNKDIFSIKRLANMVVTFEAPYVKREVVQCKRCQRFGHTRNQCNRPYRCVKCKGDHATADCKKNAQSPPQCINCGEHHPANYRGCQMYQRYKEHIYRSDRGRPQPHLPVQELPSQQQSSNRFRQPTEFSEQAETFPLISDKVSYADAAKGNNSRKQNHNINADTFNSVQPSVFIGLIEQMMSKFETIMERMFDRIINIVMTISQK